MHSKHTCLWSLLTIYLDCLSEIRIVHLPHWIGYGRPCCKLGRSDLWKDGGSLYGACLDDWWPWWPPEEVIPDINSKVERPDQRQCSLNISIQFSQRLVKYDYIISETSPYIIPSKSAISHLHRFRTVSTLKCSQFFFQQGHFLVLLGVS